MKKSALALCLILHALYSSAAGAMKGIVTTESNEALMGAHIYIAEIDARAVANSLGKFQFSNIQSGKYTIMISFIGFETQKFNIEIKDCQTLSLYSKLKEGGLQLDDLVISVSHDRPVNTLSQTDIKLRPINTSQDILRMVPGLFIGQHAGGGKAEQIFLRGFDIDHGTDINIEVDGMPVNMVSHAHGQGFATMPSTTLPFRTR